MRQMDFGVVSHTHTAPPGQTELQNETGHGSTNVKHQRSGLPEDSWKLSKMPRPDEIDFSSKKGIEKSSFWTLSGIDDGQKMLSFSSSELHFNGGLNDSGCSRSIAFSISQDELRSRTGGRLNEGMHGSFARLRGPFTPSQWMELEHQALIYKHIVANVPVPSSLLLPLKRSLYSYGSPGSYGTNFFGWGPFHLGFSGSTDPEPGRCRRTDGKKWRCSRDAVPDQKYCERHINRGRHRSRKPVEGRNGHAVSGSTTSPKVAPIASSSSASVISNSSASNSLGAIQHQCNSLQPNTSNSSINNLINRTQGYQGLSLIPSTNDLKPNDVPFSVQKHDVPTFQELSTEFGLVSSDSLVNPTERISYVNTRNPDSYLGFNDKETNNQHPVHHFIDDWPKDQSDRASGSWPDDLKSDWTQLSMSIPLAPDFSSSSSAPGHAKSTTPTLCLSHELKPIHMSLGVGHDRGEQIQKQSARIPISWRNSMGGPLGEVLTSTVSSAGVETMSSLKDWKNNNTRLGSSPTGVLQKSAFGTLSNSSSRSSPPSTDNNEGPDSSGLPNDLLGSALIHSAAIPSL